MVKELNSENFKQEVVDNKLEGKTPFVLVDFFATWCGPCQMMGPVIEELDKDLNNQFPGKISVAKLDIDVSSDIAQEYNVMSVPTLIIFKKGKEVYRSTGFTHKEVLKNAVSGIINQ